MFVLRREEKFSLEKNWNFGWVSGRFWNSRYQSTIKTQTWGASHADWIDYKSSFRCSPALVAVIPALEKKLGKLIRLSPSSLSTFCNLRFWESLHCGDAQATAVLRLLAAHWVGECLANCGRSRKRTQPQLLACLPRKSEVQTRQSAGFPT